MAIYHLCIKFVSRSTGHSAVKAAAYICGQDLHEDRTGLHAYYEKKHSHVAVSKTIFPENSQYKDLSVWNAAENYEDLRAEQRGRTEVTREKFKSTARTALNMIVSLPNELSLEENISITEELINRLFTPKRLITTYAIHDNDKNNIHAHILTTRRAIDESGNFEKTKTKFPSLKELYETRKLWADIVNKHLEQNGLLDRISEKSFAKLGIQLKPIRTISWYAYMHPEKETNAIKGRQAIIEYNKNKILSEPFVIFDYMMKIKGHCEEQLLRKELQSRGLNESEIDEVCEKVSEIMIDQQYTNLENSQEFQINDNEVVSEIEQAFWKKIDEYKVENSNPDRCSSEQIIKNEQYENLDVYMENSEAHRQTHGYGLQIDFAMIKNYIENFQLTLPFREEIAELASLLADKFQTEIQPISAEDANTCIKEALCYFILNEANLEQDERFSSAYVLNVAMRLALHLTDDNIAVLNDEQLVQEALETITPLNLQTDNNIVQGIIDNDFSFDDFYDDIQSKNNEKSFELDIDL